MSYRDTDFYKKLDLYTACETVEWAEDSIEEEKGAAWQWLVDTGHAWKLQGWYGRTAYSLLRLDLIEQPKGGDL